MLLKRLALCFLTFVLSVVGALFFILSLGCSTQGVRVTVCIVDAQNNGYECRLNDASDIGHFVGFSEIKDLRCYSPKDMETLIKTCQSHATVKLKECTFQVPGFTCIDTDGTVEKIDAILGENYVCLSDQDLQRVLDRCS